jgi:hypothetical protein
MVPLSIPKGHQFETKLSVPLQHKPVPGNRALSEAGGGGQDCPMPVISQKSLLLFWLYLRPRGEGDNQRWPRGTFGAKFHPEAIGAGTVSRLSLIMVHLLPEFHGTQTEP